MVNSPSGTFKTSEEFFVEEIGLHINEKETIALYKVFHAFLEAYGEYAKGKCFVVHVDSKVLFDTFNKGSTVNKYITDSSTAEGSSGCKQITNAT